MATGTSVANVPRVRARAAAIGLALWIGGVGVAIIAQYLLTPIGAVREGWSLYAVASVLTVVGVSLIDRVIPPPDPSSDAQLTIVDGSVTTATSSIVHRSVWFFRLAFGLATVCTTGGAIYLLAAHSDYDRALWLWLGSLLLLVGAMTFGAAERIRLYLPRLTRRQSIELAIVIAILALAAILRLPDLAEIPPEVHGDEAAIGLEARRILRGEMSGVYGVGWYDVPNLSFGIPAVFMAFFGNNLYGLRLASVFQGILSVLVAYLLFRRLFTPRVAILAAFLLAVSQWHIHFSRTGGHYMQALLATILLFYWSFRAIQDRRLVDFAIAGFTVGLCLNVYYSARLAPALVALYLVYRAIRERDFLPRYKSGILALVIGTLVFMAPMLAYYAQKPQSFLTRTQGVLIFSPQNLQHLQASYKVEGVENVLLVQTLNTLQAFNLRGETTMQYGHRAPLLDFWTSTVFVLGTFVVLLRAHQPRYFFLASWMWLTLLLGAVLTIDAPSSLRIIGVLPALVVLSALVIDGGWRGADALFGRTGTYAFVLPVGVFLALAARANYHDYFELHVNKHQPAGFFTVLSRYVSSINDQYRIYFIGKRDSSLKYDTARFLIPDVDGVDVRDEPLDLPLGRVPRAKGVAFLVETSAPDAAQRLEAITRAYPGGREEVHKNATGVTLFTSYLVEHDALLAAKPDALIDDAPIPALRPSQLAEQAPSPAGLGN